MKGASALSAHPHFDLCCGVVVDVIVGEFSVTRSVEPRPLPVESTPAPFMRALPLTAAARSSAIVVESTS